MAEATSWEREYESTTAECVKAAAMVALEPSPRVWPASGSMYPDATFNPDGHPISKNKPPKLIVDRTIHDEDATGVPGRD